MFFKWAIFSVNLVHDYLTFQVSYAQFPALLPINEYSPHNNKQFGGCLINIKQKLSILQVF